MADEKVNMGPEENKTPENQFPPSQGDLPPLEENNAPAVSGKIKRPPIMWSPIRRLPTSTHSRLFFTAWAKIHRLRLER